MKCEEIEQRSILGKTLIQKINAVNSNFNSIESDMVSKNSDGIQVIDDFSNDGGASNSVKCVVVSNENTAGENS